jgi:acetyltransferase
MTATDSVFQQAMNSLLHPRRIALIGASPRLGFANSIQIMLEGGGYDGELLPVNPRYEEIRGRRCYPSLDAIPGHVDLAIVVVPAAATMDVLEQCAAKGVGAISMIASGFGEKADDPESVGRQHAIRDFARRSGIRVAGPNCLGNISVPNKMTAFSGPFDKPLPRGPLGVVFQSGLLSYSVVGPLIDRQIGFTYVITSGNEADLDATDYMRYFIEDDETRVIGAFIEQFRDPAKLLEVAELAAERKKPIVVLKIGRSEGGRRAALAHTGSLVGADEAADAVMRQHGIIRVDSIDELNETLAIFHTDRLPKGDGLATVFMSGGAAGLVSDLSQGLGLRHPELAPETTAKLAEVIPAYGTVGNPLDMTGQIWAMPGGMEKVFRTLAEDPNLDIIVYGRAYPAQLDIHPDSAEFPANLPDEFPDKTFLIMGLASGRLREQEFEEQRIGQPVSAIGGIPFLQGAENSLRAIRSLLRYAAFQRQRASVGPIQRGPGPLAERARELLRAAGGRPLLEREAKALLALYDIPVTREFLTGSADAAVEAARAIGYPVALKIISPDLPHKTEAGGVLLGVDSDQSVLAGFSQIKANARRFKPDARIDGVLVQQMAPAGRELILGMTRDPDFGPAIAVGLGGVFVETLRDVALGVPPLTQHDARAMLTRLRAYRVLEGSGARGAAPADLGALVSIITRFSQLCLDLRDEVAEIDINPLLVFDEGQGALVVDALVVPAP